MIAGPLAANIPSAEVIQRQWLARGRRQFCRDLDAEQFLAQIHGYGWSPSMLAKLDREVRRRLVNEPAVPLVEHLLDAAIAVRYGAA